MLRTSIVGAGPVGLVCAHLLAAQKIPVTLFERKTHLSTHPSAHVIHPGAAEILRDIGMRDLMLKEMVPSPLWKNFNYCASVTGTLYRSYDNFSSPEYQHSQELSDIEPMHFPQHKLVDILYKNLPASVEVRTGTEITDITQNPDSVRLTTKKGDIIDSDYVLACYGASADLRHKLGIKMHGTSLLQSFVNVHFFSKELGRLVSQRPAMINFVFSPKVIAALITHSAEEGEFIMQVPFLLSHEKIFSLENEDYEDMVNAAAGVELHDVKIKSVIPWKMGAEWTEEMKFDRVFLVGDAAHRMPPTGGFGMCTGFSDARNVCWKLNYPGLLHTYSTERVQHIKKIVKESVSRFQLLTTISSVCNLSYSTYSTVKNICERLPFGDFFLQGSLQVGELLFSDSKLINFLSDENRLLRLIYPEEDLEQKIEHGYVTKSGGGLGPNLSISYKGKKFHARELPAIVLKDSGIGKFVHLQGKRTAELPSGMPVETVKIEGENSYVMRPDAILFSRS